MPEQMSDRRAHVRYRVGFGAKVTTDRGTIAAGTRDMSRGGCCLESDRPLDEDAEVAVDLHLTVEGIQEPDFPHFQVGARVKWVAEGEVDGDPVHLSGIEFIALDPAQADWLEAFLKQHGLI